MASEVLAVPEDFLEEFCTLLEAGLYSQDWSPEMVDALESWIADERAYLATSASDE